jgi:hypothetical protein
LAIHKRNNKTKHTNSHRKTNVKHQKLKTKTKKHKR